ncbi:Ppx/GppA family phosphatase [Liquorilactobacillus vini]|uniref:Exopolyphosphatase n=1 Tax=Liquorilactobacillus vini DSM 20605 TaxID=1133569 RepID=A0A0R2BYV2_9LACO|nr:Ppx/GppA family phosphatase [Liquorilactobacillus vini]KRM84440.1 Exopolyphosphatase [Liquorilactobacillus vini DSM 20605]
MRNLVVLDFGSNSVRFSINQIVGKDSFQEILRQKATTRLAEGMGNASQPKKLTAKAVKRTLGAVADFQQVYQSYPECKVVGIATAAVRQAENRTDFVAQIKALTGCQIQVLTAQQETYFDYLAVINSLPLTECLIFDVGGGSCELALVKKGQFVAGISLPVGAVSLSERFSPTNDFTAQQLFALQDFLVGSFQQISWLKQAANLPLVLLGGCNRSVARLQRTRLGYAKTDLFHGFSMTTQAFKEIYATLLAKKLPERQQLPGMEANRADIILAGMSPVVLLLEWLASSKVVFSESGAREGFIYHSLKNEAAK